MPADRSVGGHPARTKTKTMTKTTDETETSMQPATKTGYVVKVYPRFSETFVVTEILAREAQGEQIAIFALRPTSDTRFHPELARVQAPVTFIAKHHKLGEAWADVAEAERLVPGFARRFADSLPELAADEASEVAQGVRLAAEGIRAGLTHLHAHFGSLAGRVAEIASRLSGIPYSVTLHAKDIFHESVELEDLSRKVAGADHVIAISDYNHSYLHRILGPELSERIVVVRNGLELERFPYRPTIAEQPSGAAQAIPSLLAVGRLVEKKGFGHLLTALARLRDRGLPCHLDLVGTGPLEDELRELIDTLHLTELVDMHGALTQSEVREMFVSHDLLVAPFVIGTDGNADGLPTVLLEGMATGIPCVAGNVTAVPEVIIDGETGWLVDDGSDPEQITTAIAEVVRRLREAPDSVREITDAARDLVCRLHDSAAQARELSGLVDQAGRALPNAGRAAPNADQAASNTDQAAPNADRELEYVS